MTRVSTFEIDRALTFGMLMTSENNDWDFDIDDSADFNDPTNPAGTAFKFYHASKLLANKATWEFREVEKPHFSLVSLHPGFVYGYNPTQISAKDVELTSNGILWRAIMKGVTDSRATGVHVQDVADAHIRALSPEISDGSKYLLIGQKTSWREIAQIVHRDYPHIGAKISVDLEEDTLSVNTSKAEKELRIQWRSFERIIHDFLDQQLELIQSEQMAV